ncbi:MAG: major capsid protein [Ignavibacteriaceae bacterium]|nr:major capsid protein [Ignavibacteriaceae bacterium]
MSLANNRIVDPVLTEIARGYNNATFIGTSLFPVVEVQKEGGKIPQFSKEAFKIYNTERAIRANSNRISPEGRTTIDFVLTEHDLEYPMDYREISEDPTPLKLHAAHVVADGIALRLEKSIADLAQTLGTYPSGNKVTLAAGDKFTNTSSDPFAIFDTAVEAIRGKIAKRPNVCVLGAQAFKALKNHPSIVDRIKYTQHAVITPELLRQLLNFEQLYVGDAVSAADDGTFSDLWSDNAVLAYVPVGSSDIPRSYYEPAFAYTLRKKGSPIVDTYGEKGKVDIVRNTDIFTAKVVGSEAGYLINDTNA